MFSASSINVHPSPASCLLAFATQTAVYPVATGKAAILRTIAPSSRRASGLVLTGLSWIDRLQAQIQIRSTMLHVIFLSRRS